MNYIIFIGISIAVVCGVFEGYRNKYKGNKIRLSLNILLSLFIIFTFSKITILNISMEKYRFLDYIIGIPLLINWVIYVIIRIRKAMKKQ